MAIKFSATVKADYNGLSVIYSDLIRNPDREHVIIAVIDTKSVAVDTDSGERTPTIRIRHVEAVAAGSVESARAMMQRAQEARTGEVELPFPAAFGNVYDLHAGSPARPGRDDDDE